MDEWTRNKQIVEQRNNIKKEKNKENSKKQLESAIEKSIMTTMIAAIAAVEEEAFIKANRIAAEVNAIKNERKVETDEAEQSCCKPVKSTEISGLLHKFINWLVSLFKE